MANNDRTLLKQKSKKDGPMEDKKQSQPLDYPASPIGLTLLGSVKPVNQVRNMHYSNLYTGDKFH